MLIFFFFRKSFRLWDVEKYGRAGQATDDMVHAHCMLDTEGYKHTLRIILIAFPLHLVSRKRLTVTLHAQYLSCLWWYSTVRRVLYRFDEYQNLCARIVDLTAKTGMSYTQQFLSACRCNQQNKFIIQWVSVCCHGSVTAAQPASSLTGSVALPSA